jgi:tRNA dimethylallyltransferase
VLTLSLLQEAKRLLDEGLQPDGKCAARAIGYRQAMAFLERCRGDSSRINADNLVTTILLHLLHISPAY